MVIAMAVARGKGLRAILSSALLTLPALAFVLALCVYLVHGWNWKSHAALTALFTTTTAGYFFTVWITHLTFLSGTADRSAVVAQNSYGLDTLSLYVVGVMLSALGAMNDITVTQASVVETVADSQPSLPFRRLYALNMQVGGDHVGSMVTVLVLGYAAGALPLTLLLRADQSTPLWVTLNGEAMFAELAGLLIALIMMLIAVSLSTVLAAWWLGQRRNRQRLPEGDPDSRPMRQERRPRGGRPCVSVLLDRTRSMVRACGLKASLGALAAVTGGST